MSRKKSNTISIAVLLFLALWLGNAVARGASFTASLDRDTISTGETATLTLRFDGDAPQNPPDPPDVPGLNFGYVGKQSVNLDINGVASSIVTFTYSVVPSKIGEFTIPIVASDPNGNEISAQPLKLIVQKANAPTTASIKSGNEVAFMTLTVPTDKVYVGQTLTAKLQIFLRDDVENYSKPQFTATPADGLSIGKSAGEGQSRAQIGDRVYTVIPISIALTATKTGTLTIGPFAANIVVIVPAQNQGGDLIAQFFNQGERKQIPLASDEIKIQSLPLPTENVPANFNGAVGNYTMTVTAGPTNVAVGDPITVRVKISGRGALDDISLPLQSDWKNFKIFSPTSKVETSGQLGLEGTKTFEQIVTPQTVDIRELPEFSFSFFNPDDGQYHTLAQPPELLTVRAGGSTPLPTMVATKNSGQQNQAPQDILPIKNDLGTLAQISAPLVTNPIFFGAQSLPLLAFLGALIWRKRKENLANNPRLRRKLHVEKLVQEGIADLKKFAGENNSEEFFATLFRLLQEQLGERLDCPATAITENVIEENSALRGAPENLRNDLRELFQLCNQARYAPVRGTAELNSVAEKFETAARELQEVNA